MIHSDPHFRYIISQFHHRRGISNDDKRDQLFAADQLAEDEKQPKLFLPNRLACLICLDVKPSEQFSDRNTYKARRVGGKDAHHRFCLDCGLKYSKYQVGQKLNINRVCRIVTRRTVRYTHATQLEIVENQPIGLGPDDRFGEVVDDSFGPDLRAYTVDRFEAIST